MFVIRARPNKQLGSIQKGLAKRVPLFEFQVQAP